MAVVAERNGRADGWQRKRRGYVSGIVFVGRGADRQKSAVQYGVCVGERQFCGKRLAFVGKPRAPFERAVLFGGQGV